MSKKQVAPVKGQPVANSKVAAKKKGQEFNPDDYVKLSVSRDEVLEIKKAFDLLDTDKSGSISPNEIREQFDKLGLLSNSKVLYQVLGELDEDHSGGIDFNEFFSFLTAKVNEKDKKEEIVKLFKFFDDNDNGKIQWAELKRVAQYLGEEMTDEEIHHMFDKADLDDDGFITKDDFYNIVTGKGYY